MRKSETEAPDSLEMTESLRLWGVSNGFSDEILRKEAVKMLDWHKMNGKRRSDWPATLRNWMRKYAEMRGEKPAPVKVAVGYKPGYHVCRICETMHEWKCDTQNCGHSYFLACKQALADIDNGKYRT